ncbi:MAG TPA: alpha/beta hydrolase family protein [Candidatus Acidoferrales bacterium]|nr:alpha/beta hydrolase family protein [Candidatus Acidoferrales bacterium]
MRFRRRAHLLRSFLLVLFAAGGASEMSSLVPAAPQNQPAAGGRVECGSVPSKMLAHSVRFCAVLPPSYDAHPGQRFPVLYWLHGLGQDEQSFISAGGVALLEDMRGQNRLGEFLIITPDAGRSFYLNSRDGYSRYEDFFIREFLPAMERRYRIEAGRATRGISGVSMGGFGALHFGLKYPQLFGSVSAHSAALMEKPPAAMTNGARLGFLEAVFGWPVDPAFWDRNSVFTAARHAHANESLKIYFDCGTADDFGFDEGAQALDRLLTSRGIPHEFHVYPGGHGWGYFAKHLPASLEFHWKAFHAAQESSGP